MNNVHDIVREFEKKVAEYMGFKHGQAVDCCTHGIFLALQYLKNVKQLAENTPILIPDKTYISVPVYIQLAGMKPKLNIRNPRFSKFYYLGDTCVVDGAKLWAKNAKEMYGFADRDMVVLSFHAKKPLPIGRGGMILTNSDEAKTHLDFLRYDGRLGVPYDFEDIGYTGYHMYMTPEQAARGLHLMTFYPNGLGNREDEDYPSISKMPIATRNGWL